MSVTPIIERPSPKPEFSAIGHPCFDRNHKAAVARLHLPVAPRCNVQCRFCDRSFDCVNESRPGVTAALLSPEEALVRVDTVRKRLPNLRVVGIAGPGDPLANPLETMETFRLVRSKHPDLALCLATNGLALPGKVAELVDAGVSHLTVTVNAVDAGIGSRVYSWIRFDGRARTGVDAARFLLERQLEGIGEAAAAGLVVKVNTILIPGLNLGEVGSIARECSARGATFMNAIPLLPVKGTALESSGEPSKEAVAEARRTAAIHLPQLSHCSRCRADAAGLLGKDIELDVKEEAEAIAASNSNGGTIQVAVSSREGLLVNRHLGEADRLFIFRVRPSGDYETVDIRMTPGEGSGPARWTELADLISDCECVLTSGIGAPPRRILEDRGIKVHVMEGLVGEALEAVSAGKDLSFLSRRTGCEATGGCSGAANRGCGCA
ncbi:MAG: hypothetical protein A2Z99_18950 [Treponema sp. GWB1_62_6]|nr:MAG: hypothetical protein A2001_05285 [Treponema sp. GWC1_61_84]OHE70426.1 MAG: hypothetical protein A2Z99_18950 [Treponema sp. GWB1_62_6]HCM29074.1 nitrogen fixation protein NifB [Treponema sp.]